jgi:hypothetical protein
MSIILTKNRSLTITKFAKRLNYPRASNHEFKRILALLERNRYVVVQQGGFLGDNIHHDIIVTVRKPIELDKFKRIILTRVNYTIDDYTVHRAERLYKCDKCRRAISLGERYGSRVQVSGKSKAGKRHIFARSIICLPCLLAKKELEEFMEAW